MKVSPSAVREEIRFMREIIELFSDAFLTDEEKKDWLYSKVILNEHKYFEYWLEHPELEEVAINADAMKLLVTKIYDLDLPTRIMNCFRVLDINYMFELVDKKPKDFLVYRNMGEKSMKQLTDYVESLGFCFDYKIRFSEKDKLYYTLK
jgi:DNA-directed RNA polymerase alpha subunit